MLLLSQDMNNTILQFRRNLLRARELGNLGTSINNIVTSGIDISDIWRAQIVLCVSALDYLIHELTRIGMIEIAKGNRPKTDSFLKFPLPIDAMERALNGQAHEFWLGDTIREKHSWLSFQHPDKIADAIRLISSKKLWEEVGTSLNMKAKDIKLRVEIIVDRRNKIAHEADMDPTNPGFQWPIDSLMASKTIDEIERVGEAIFSVVV